MVLLGVFKLGFGGFIGWVFFRPTLLMTALTAKLSGKVVYGSGFGFSALLFRG